METYKSRLPKSWFIKRVGKYIIKNHTASLFDPPIFVASPQHAAAIYASQDKGHRYAKP